MALVVIVVIGHIILPGLNLQQPDVTSIVMMSIRPHTAIISCMYMITAQKKGIGGVL